jgi:hypothetical protein
LIEFVDRPGSPVYAVERFIEGEYVKVGEREEEG